jgi:hypothetical protein
MPLFFLRELRIYRTIFIRNDGPRYALRTLNWELLFSPVKLLYVSFSHNRILFNGSRQTPICVELARIL